MPGDNVFQSLDKAFSKFLMFVLRHWLLTINLIVFLFIVPIILAPILFWLNDPTANAIGSAIMLVYKVTCHQMPSRSLFVCDHQMAVCSRCFAIYISFLFGGILFSFIRTKLKPWSLKYYILFCIPMAVDGLTQLVGLRESDTTLRVITGAIFGLASALYVFPYFQMMFATEEKDMERILKKEAEKEKEQKPPSV